MTGSGFETVVRVGVRGKLEVDALTDLSEASALNIYIYSEAEWNDGSPPSKTLPGILKPGSTTEIQVDMPADLFPASGKYYICAGVAWGGGEIPGAPAEVLVIRGT